MNLLTAPQTVPFGAAFVVMLGLTVLELVGLLSSFSPSEWIDHSLLPEPHSDAALDGVLGWLHLGKVPTLILLVLLLAGFSICGYLVQMLASSVSGAYLPGLVASLPAGAGAIAAVRLLGGALGRVIPRDESSIVSEREFIGRVATITSASTREGLASQARLRDAHGRAHFLLAEPDVAGLVLADGMEVLVVSRVGSIYRVIANPHPTLM
jgi:hypothetical protein